MPNALESSSGLDRIAVLMENPLMSLLAAGGPSFGRVENFVRRCGEVGKEGQRRSDQRENAEKREKRTARLIDANRIR